MLEEVKFNDIGVIDRLIKCGANVNYCDKVVSIIIPLARLYQIYSKGHRPEGEVTVNQVH